MLTLYDRTGTRHEFADANAIVSHFGIDLLTPSDLAGIRAASNAGFPLHAGVDPYAEEIRDMRVLLLEPTAAELDAECRQRRADI